MRAILVREFGGPGVLTIGEAADPEPGPGQVLVRIHAAGVNPFDTYMRTGNYAIRPPLPYIPGADAAGVVEAVGRDVSGLAAGARVWTSGTAAHRSYGAYAEQAVCEPHQVHALADRLSYAQGAGVGVPYVTAYRALHDRARIQPGETLLVHGASGGVGLAAIQIARASGLTVVATAGSPDGLDLVRAQGAHHALDHGKAGYLDTLPEVTGGAGPSVILENLANVNLDNDLTALAPGGRIVIVGNRGRLEIDPRKAMSKEAVILGMSFWHTRPEDLARITRALDAGLENGTLAPVVASELALADAPRAHERILEPGARGKLVLIPDP